MEYKFFYFRIFIVLFLMCADIFRLSSSYIYKKRILFYIYFRKCSLISKFNVIGKPPLWVPTVVAFHVFHVEIDQSNLNKTLVWKKYFKKDVHFFIYAYTIFVTDQFT